LCRAGLCRCIRLVFLAIPVCGGEDAPCRLPVEEGEGGGSESGGDLTERELVATPASPPPSSVPLTFWLLHLGQDLLHRGAGEAFPRTPYGHRSDPEHRPHTLPLGSRGRCRLSGHGGRRGAGRGGSRGPGSSHSLGQQLQQGGSDRARGGGEGWRYPGHRGVRRRGRGAG